MLGQDDGSDVDFAQAHPRKDDGGCHHDNQPERRRVNESMTEGFAFTLVVVCQEDNLTPNEGRGSPSKVAVGLLEGIMVHTTVPWVREENDADEQHQNEVGNGYSSDRRLCYR